MANTQPRRRAQRREAADEPEVFMARAAIIGSIPDTTGVYSNFASVGQSTHEIVIDFAILASSGDRDLIEQWAPKQVYPAVPIARVRLPRDVAEGLAAALSTQIEKARNQEVFRAVPADEQPQ